MFAENVRRRSRTAKGRDEGAKTSSAKKPLRLQGDALVAKTAENVAQLIDDAWNARLRWPDSPDDPRTATLSKRRAVAVLPLSLRAMCERWYDIASNGLVDVDAYREDFEKLEEAAVRARKLSYAYGKVNRRYRLWTPAYTTLLVPPIRLEDEMGGFYARTSSDLASMLDFGPAVGFGGAMFESMCASSMAYVDVMMDGEVHPWLDGCSRVATTFVMWIAASFRVRPPLFAPTKAAHYERIRDVDAHVAYFLECAARSRDFE